MTISTADLVKKIPGWGVDLKPENRPGVPKEKAAPNGTGAHWQVPEQQKPDMKIHHTIERTGLTPVFGSTIAPKLISGKLRDYAYTLSESQISRWVTLLMADRIDMIESIISDVLHLRAGNPIQQTGVLVELKERGQFARVPRKRLTIAVGAGLVGVIAAAWANSSRKMPTNARVRKKAA